MRKTFLVLATAFFLTFGYVAALAQGPRGPRAGCGRCQGQNCPASQTCPRMRNCPRAQNCPGPANCTNPNCQNPNCPYQKQQQPPAQQQQAPAPKK